MHKAGRHNPIGTSPSDACHPRAFTQHTIGPDCLVQFWQDSLMGLHSVICHREGKRTLEKQISICTTVKDNVRCALFFAGGDAWDRTKARQGRNPVVYVRCSLLAMRVLHHFQVLPHLCTRGPICFESLGPKLKTNTHRPIICFTTCCF